jgi:hypothetical protein
MIALDDPIYFYNIRLDQTPQQDFWAETREECDTGGKFYIDIAKRLTQNRFVTRNGEWSLPWKQPLIPGFEMPPYDPNFSKSYEQVTDERALQMRQRIHNGEKLVVMYSGGMDSTLVLASLIKNLNEEELKSVVVCASIHSIAENPVFWEKFIHNKLKVIDSYTCFYDDLIHDGYRPITADEGDCIFGTSIGLQLYHNYDYYIQDLSPEVRQNLLGIKDKISSADAHYSLYKDLIIKHLSYDSTPEGREFGRLLYHKYVHNANTGTVPIHSLHDFFWWLIFNVKYLNCSVRGAIYFNYTIPVRECIDSMENWYNGGEYQQWSMANNNNGQKIGSTLATYKYAQRKYIYDLDKNDWYFHFKTKLESLGNLNSKRKPREVRKDVRGRYLLGLDSNYQLLNRKNLSVRRYFKYHLQRYEIDWPN